MIEIIHVNWNAPDVTSLCKAFRDRCIFCPLFYLHFGIEKPQPDCLIFMAGTVQQTSTTTNIIDPAEMIYFAVLNLMWDRSSN